MRFSGGRFKFKTRLNLPPKPWGAIEFPRGSASNMRSRGHCRRTWRKHRWVDLLTPLPHKPTALNRVRVTTGISESPTRGLPSAHGTVMRRRIVPTRARLPKARACRRRGPSVCLGASSRGYTTCIQGREETSKHRESSPEKRKYTRKEKCIRDKKNLHNKKTKHTIHCLRP